MWGGVWGRERGWERGAGLWGPAEEGQCALSKGRPELWGHTKRDDGEHGGVGAWGGRGLAAGGGRGHTKQGEWGQGGCSGVGSESGDGEGTYDGTQEMRGVIGIQQKRHTPGRGHTEGGHRGAWGVGGWGWGRGRLAGPPVS